jgi:medium-chain acyl-[acyl-carrier-protein] hydrolase
MQPIYQQDFEVNDMCVDRYGRMKLSTLLFIAQEMAGQHCMELALDYDTLAQRRLFWAVTRHRVQITRLPNRGEKLHVQTWPMPTTRVAYPRSMVAYDQQGRECFRSISLWVLMDLDSRLMVLPKKSGIDVCGTLTGTELTAPGSLVPKPLSNSRLRSVCFTDLDRNGHMNNTRYLDWIDDLLPSPFHESNSPREFTICYLSEAREGQDLELNWEVQEGNVLRVDAHRTHTEPTQNGDRVFAAQIIY